MIAVMDAVEFEIRAPAPGEIAGIVDLFEEEVRAGRMLPRNPLEIRATLDDWLVAVDGDLPVGCVSLVFYDGDLCEVRSLAVDPTYRGRGLGLALIKAAVQLAVQRDMSRVLTLTRAIRVFDAAGFEIDDRMNYPQKVWRDCRPCPLRHRCDETAMIYHIKPGGGPHV